MEIYKIYFYRYNEYKNYSYDNPLGGSIGTIGDFTQLVWKSSQKLGVGVATYRKDGNFITIIVARYSPAGNVGDNDAYKKNVLKRKNPHGNI